MSFFEDLRVGDRQRLGSHRFEREEIIAFAREFDPQRFHLSEETARDWPFGRLAASGWHSAAICMRLRVDTLRKKRALAEAEGKLCGQFGPSPGFKDLRWERPVYAGDTVTFYEEIVALRPSRSRPSWGLVSARSEGINQDGAPVLSLVAQVFLERRERIRA